MPLVIRHAPEILKVGVLNGFFWWTLFALLPVPLPSWFVPVWIMFSSATAGVWWMRANEKPAE